MKLQKAKITEVKIEGNQTQYDLAISGEVPDLWGKPGLYPTLNQAIDTFRPRLKQVLVAQITHQIENGGSAAFSMRDAFENLA